MRAERLLRRTLVRRPCATPRAARRWLGSVLAGSQVCTIAVGGEGGPGAVVGGAARTVDQVLELSGVTSQVRYFVMRTDGLQSVSSTLAALIAADPSSPSGNSAPPHVTAPDVSAAVPTAATSTTPGALYLVTDSATQVNRQAAR